MSTLDEIIKEKQRVSEALARVDAQHDKLTSQLSELEATERVLALQQRHAAKKGGRSQNPDHGNAGECFSGTTRAPAHYNRKTCRRQADLAEPQRSGPCPGNRQNAAGNHRCMEGRASEPCRRSDCPAQARWPHRRARREALRHTVDGDRATRCGLKPG